MSSEWATLPPKAESDIKPFQLSIPPSEVEQMLTLLKASVIPPPTYFSSTSENYFGVTQDWITSAREYWLNTYSWAEAEKRINRHPHFKTEVADDKGFKYDLHFIALFSRRPDAIPIAFFHGWPGSFLEFMDLFDLVRTKFTPETSPYHFIAPSLPGYTLSSGPAPDRLLDIPQASALLDRLLVKIGFGDGYIAQGGDVGSFVSQTLSFTSPRTKGIHLNMIGGRPPANAPPPDQDPDLTDADRHALVKGGQWVVTGSAYAREHDTRPATIGFVLSSSPLALLAWVGEKMKEWSDPAHQLSLENILTNVSLYWLTNTISRSMYPYRGLITSEQPPRPFIKQPLGYSQFKHEILNQPKKWIAELGNLQSFKQHENGGHFAAWERPADLWADVEEYVTKSFPNGLPK